MWNNLTLLDGFETRFSSSQNRSFTSSPSEHAINKKSMLIFIVDCFLIFNLCGTDMQRSLESLLVLCFLSCVQRLLRRNRWKKDFSRLAQLKFRLRDWNSKLKIALRLWFSTIATWGDIWFSILARSFHDFTVFVERRWHSYRRALLTSNGNFSELTAVLLRILTGRIRPLTVVWFATVDVVDMLCCGVLAHLQSNNSDGKNCDNMCCLDSFTNKLQRIRWHDLASHSAIVMLT